MIKVEHNVDSNELIEREMTDEEIAIYNTDIEAARALREKNEAEETLVQAAKESAQVKLAALGLTPEEIAALSK